VNNNHLFPSTFIPIKWYSDESLAVVEQKELENHPYYLGSKFIIPHIGNYVVSEFTFKNFVLIHSENGINAVSNICRHRQSLLLQGYGSRKTITCPLHYWKYALNGKGLSAYDFGEDYQCPDLPTLPMTQWGALFFKHHESIQKILDETSSIKKLKTEDYLFRSIEVLECDYNWKIFMETYLDLYHINTIHPGLRKFANCENPQWEINEFSSSQTVDVMLLPDQNPSLPYTTYAKYILDYAGSTTAQKITWFSVYPNTMIEIYPYHMAISSIIPLSATKSLNVIEFYMDAALEDYEHGEAMHQAFKESYLETAAEDDVACQKIQLGRNNLFKNQTEDHGPYHNPLELGIPSFYQFWNMHFRS